MSGHASTWRSIVCLGFILLNGCGGDGGSAPAQSAVAVDHESVVLTTRSTAVADAQLVQVTLNNAGNSHASLALAPGAPAAPWLSYDLTPSGTLRLWMADARAAPGFASTTVRVSAVLPDNSVASFRDVVVSYQLGEILTVSPSQLSFAYSARTGPPFSQSLTIHAPGLTWSYTTSDNQWIGTGSATNDAGSRSFLSSTNTGSVTVPVIAYGDELPVGHHDGTFTVSTTDGQTAAARISVDVLPVP